MKVVFIRCGICGDALDCARFMGIRHWWRRHHWPLITIRWDRHD